MAKVKLRGIAAKVGEKIFKPGADGMVDCTLEEAVQLMSLFGAVEVKQGIVKGCPLQASVPDKAPLPPEQDAKSGVKPKAKTPGKGGMKSVSVSTGRR